jgi:hypothetical protein
MKKRKKLFVLTAIIVASAVNFKGDKSFKVIGAVEYGVDLAFGRRVVSSAHTDDHLNIHAVDARSDTRYAAVSDDNAFFYVDLGGIERVGKVVIDWEAAYASEYLLQMSMDAVTWTTIATVTKTNNDIDEIEFPKWIETQFVKFQGVSRALEYGYSFYSFEVYGPKSLGVAGDVVYASSYENPTILPSSAILDNEAHTRWASQQQDNECLIFDFKSPVIFDLIKVRWEVSFARIFKIYTHPETTSTSPTRDDDGWTYLTGTEAGLGEVDTFKLTEEATSRYVKVDLIQRETSENTKKTGRYPWESTFSIYSFDIYKEADLPAVKLGHKMEFSHNSPAWVAMSNITLHDEGLILAPHGYPIEADGVVTNMESIADGNIPGFESYATYNPAVIYDEDRNIFHMIYRSELPDRFDTYYGERYELGHMSTLSYAYSYDGVHFTRGDNNPIAWPTISEEHGGGLEDPRMFKIVNDPNRGGVTTYYITYTMYDYSITREGMIYTQDFVTFNKVGRLAPDYPHAYKSGTFLTDPEGNLVKISDPRPGKFGQVYMIFGFTGTPIFASNTTAGNKFPTMKTTEQVFGKQLHTYTIVDAIRDGNVLPFRIDYINTARAKDELLDEEVYDIEREKALLAPNRISEITKYILEHFYQKTKRNERSYEYSKITNIKEVARRRNKAEEVKEKTRITGFNSLFAVASIEAAKRYYNEFKKQQKDLIPDKQIKVAIIYSWNPNEGSEFEQDGLFDENNENTEKLDKPSRDFLDEAIKDYNNYFGTSYDTSSEKFQNYYKDLSLRVKNREVDLLIVVF